MSYGKWKALNPRTEVAEHEVPKTGPRKLCKNCGMEIPLSYRGFLYCGEECAYEAKKARTREFTARRKERMRANGKV